jgi:hypothetical protein
MKLNGISVQGIYIYNEGNSTYEVGDLVLYKNGIYIYSKSEDVLSDGKTPDISKDYTPYLGDKLASLKDWQEFIDGNGEDKYLTIKTLVAILNSYMNDMRLDGIIKSHYDTPEGETVDGWVLDEYELGSDVADNSAIDEILRSNSNYAIYRVSRKLQGLWMVNYDTSEISGNFTDEDRSSVIIKQYTYYSSDTDKENGIQTRIQELIDHVDGTVYYRHAKFDPTLDNNGVKGNLSSVSDWHSTKISKQYENQIQSIINIYSAKIKSLNELEISLKKNFKFKTIDITPGLTSIVINDNMLSNEKNKKKKSITSIGPITINLREKIISTNIYYKSHEVTIEYKDSHNRSKFLLGDGLYITVSSTDKGELQIDTSSDDLTIQSMYYREYYNYESYYERPE